MVAEIAACSRPGSPSDSAANFEQQLNSNRRDLLLVHRTAWRGVGGTTKKEMSVKNFVQFEFEPSRFLYWSEYSHGRRFRHQAAYIEVMDEAVQSYIDGIGPENRPLFDRIHQLILEDHPEATVVISYGIPTYKVGNRRLFLGAWKHGLSIYGWQQGREAHFISRHPTLKTSKGTIQLRAKDAADIGDEEIRGLISAAFDD
jgi:uncharacterized protein YdhG (YjbR/CyaY superfamily)